MLLDGLDLTAPARQNEERAGRLSYAFHRFGSATLEPPRNEIRRLALFLGELEPGSPNEGVHSWAREKLSQDARLVDEAQAAKTVRREAEAHRGAAAVELSQRQRVGPSSCRALSGATRSGMSCVA